MSIHSHIFAINDDRYNPLLDYVDYDGRIFESDFIDDIDDEVENKIIKIAKVVKGLDADLEIIKSEMERLRKLKTSTELNIAVLKQYVLYAMMTIEKKAIDVTYMTVMRRKSPPKTIIADETKIPKEFLHIEQVIEKRVMKKEIAEAIKEGREVEGAYLEYGESVIIK